MYRRALSIATLAALTITASTACQPGPEPHTTQTPKAIFASEEEAFAAAEEVYRAYNDALNQARASDSSSTHRQFLMGSALESDLASERYIDEHRLHIEGDGTVADFRGDAVDLDEDHQVVARVCLDVSATRVFDAQGADITPPDRQERLPLSVTFVAKGSELLITESTLIEGETC